MIGLNIWLIYIYAFYKCKLNKWIMGFQSYINMTLMITYDCVLITYNHTRFKSRNIAYFYMSSLYILNTYGKLYMNDYTFGLFNFLS